MSRRSDPTPTLVRNYALHYRYHGCRAAHRPTEDQPTPQRDAMKNQGDSSAVVVFRRGRRSERETCVVRDKAPRTLDVSLQFSEEDLAQRTDPMFSVLQAEPLSASPCDTYISCSLIGSPQLPYPLSETSGVRTSKAKDFLRKLSCADSPRKRIVVTFQ